MAGFSNPVLLAFVIPWLPPYNPRGQALGFGLFRVRSPLLAESLLLSFPPGTEMFHFPGLALTALWIQAGVLGLQPSGLPHSEILGSMPACGSPRLFAACHVLRRLPAPRHPPYALSSLTRFQLSWRLDKSDLFAVRLPYSSFQRTSLDASCTHRCALSVETCLSFAQTLIAYVRGLLFLLHPPPALVRRSLCARALYRAR